MENASKALIIAGGILISILVISIGVYLFANYGDVSSSHDKNMEAIEIQKFNSNFTKFEGRDDITIHEIITLVNFAKQSKEETGIEIEISINGGIDIKYTNTITLIQENSTISEGGVEKVRYFEFGYITYDEKGKVSKIDFKGI